MSERRVFLDANVIIEAFRISAWSELSKGYGLETVQECEKEALTGETTHSGYVVVDPKALRAGLRQSHLVGKPERRALVQKCPLCLGMDPGEKDLFAHLYTLPQPLSVLVVVSSADKGVVVRAKELGWLQNLVSLEELLQGCGVSPTKISTLQHHHGNKFLSSVRTKVLLNQIP